MSIPSLEPALRQAATLHQSGRLAEAERIYRQILLTQPAHADALHLIGVLFSQTGRHDEACDSIQRAIAISPQNASFHRNLGTAQRHLGRLDQAIFSWERALALQPNSPDLLKSLGMARKEKGQLQDAIVCFRKSIAMKPVDADAHFHLALALESAGEIDRAILSHEKAVEVNAEHQDAWGELTRLYRDRGRIEESIASQRRARAHVYSQLVMTLQYEPTATSQDLLAEARHWNERFAKPLARLIQPHVNDRRPDRRLRIGYVSPDFSNHVVGQFILPLISRHDRSAFEVFCYSNVKQPDAVTQLFQNACDVWRDITKMSDEQAASMIRQDQIDILVDLAMHTPGNRLLVFARKPAPLQFTFAAYPGTTGLDAIDFRLTDPYLDPPGSQDENYSENSIRLPDTILCRSVMPDNLTVAESPAARGYVTFGSLNNFCKVNDAVLLAWSAILNKVADSRLLMLVPPEESARQLVISSLTGRGVNADRIEFIGTQLWSEYLQTYNRIDILLDTWPYNGYTTSIDALWMGVPIVTLSGQTAVGRAGLSILSNLNLPQLAASSVEEYQQIAVNLACDLNALRELRSTLRQRLRGSPLMNTVSYVRGVEGAFRNQWQQWCGR